VKIKVSTNTYIPEMVVERGESEIEEGETVGDLLLKLFKGTPLEEQTVDRESGKAAIDDMWEVRINGIASYGLPLGLETPLRNGDDVTIWLVPLGGG
jgi:hypothetical protein